MASERLNVPVLYYEVAMSLKDEFSKYSDDDLDEFGRHLLEKHGVEGCRAAAKLEEAAISDATLGTYKPHVRKIVAGTKSTNPSPEAVIEFLSSSDIKESTISVAVSAFKKYYSIIEEANKAEKLNRLAKKRSFVGGNSADGMEVKEWITKDEMLKIEEHILPDGGEKTKHIEAHDRSWVVTAEHNALVYTLFYTGCRVGEICKRFSADEGLGVDDIYFDDRQVKLYRLKKKTGGYGRDMKAVPDKLLEVLKDYIDIYELEGEDLLFDFTTRTAGNRIKTIDEICKFFWGEYEHMEKLTPHKFRHGRVTDIGKASGIEAASEFVEHSSLDVTKGYKHVTAEEQRENLPENQDRGQELTVDMIMNMLDVDTEEEAKEKLSEITE